MCSNRIKRVDYFTCDNFEYIKDPYGFIYVITNLINGKRYIGQKKFDSCGRWIKYMGGGKYLKKSQLKYGIENFKRDIIKVCYSSSELDYFEKYFVDYFNAVISEDYYNMIEGGNVGKALQDKFKISNGTKWLNLKNGEIINSSKELNEKIKNAYDLTLKVVYDFKEVSWRSIIRTHSRFIVRLDDVLDDGICRFCGYSGKKVKNNCCESNACIKKRDELNTKYEICDRCNFEPIIVNYKYYCNCGKYNGVKVFRGKKRICEICGEEFNVKNNRQKHCEKCKNK